MSSEQDRGQAMKSFTLEVEVSGSPEEVWQAIATGPGISAWFVPTEVAERDGGAIRFRFGPGDDMQSLGRITAWQPPRRFAYEEKDWAPGAPPIATEFVVEARNGGTCVVRLVTSLFTSDDDWDDQLSSMEAGWPGFLHVLRLYLARFAGQSAASIHLAGRARGPRERAWDELLGALGLAGAVAGQRRAAGGDAPPLAGVVDRVDERAGNRELTLRTDEPAPGVCVVYVHGAGEPVHTGVILFLYGDRAAGTAERDERRWRAWMEARSLPAG